MQKCLGNSQQKLHSLQITTEDSFLHHRCMWPTHISLKWTVFAQQLSLHWWCTNSSKHRRTATSYDLLFRFGIPTVHRDLQTHQAHPAVAGGKEWAWSPSCWSGLPLLLDSPLASACTWSVLAPWAGRSGPVGERGTPSALHVARVHSCALEAWDRHAHSVSEPCLHIPGHFFLPEV